MITENKLPAQLVFGLDIGTRSIVGTVGYLENGHFVVVAQRTKEHVTRAMLDGQIHDIEKVAGSIRQVKEELEEAVGRTLKETCIAAAGRVLRTVTLHVDQDFDAEKTVEDEDIAGLSSLGIEQAYEEFHKSETDAVKYYCVGYSIIRYFLNGHQMGNLKDHKAKTIGADLIATFLPDEVVDGLYKAVEIAGLEVANMTLEPIAAIQVAIPEKFRMLNIALIDVGAGTSDISITKDGSIIAYGMIPQAGDGLTEIIAKHCLVDFNTAEKIKRDASEREVIEYNDIMELPQTITREEVIAVTKDLVDDMAKQAADKIKELNGGKAVSAVFVVGGGGKIAGYTEAVANEMGIQKERSAIRGEEVMRDIIFLEEGVKKDSLLVTPIGICLNYYEQSNNFIYVQFNGERVKLYDNNKLAVVDAAMQTDFSNDALFPKRGKELTFSVDGKTKVVRGEIGEACLIKVNGEAGDIHTAIQAGDIIEVQKSTAGAPAHMELQALPEYKSSITVEVNGVKITLPKFASVNGELQSGFYDIQDNDVIEMLSYYSVEQIAQFMDVIVDRNMNIYVNNKLADWNTQVYENFSVVWTLGNMQLSDYENEVSNDMTDVSYEAAQSNVVSEHVAQVEVDQKQTQERVDVQSEVQAQEQEPVQTKAEPFDLHVIVNKMPITLRGKSSYVFVDVFDYINFDLSKPKGKGIVTLLNHREAQYMEDIHEGDSIEVYWQQ